MSWKESKKERVGGQAYWRDFMRKIDKFEDKRRKELEMTVKVFSPEEILAYEAAQKKESLK